LPQLRGDPDVVGAVSRDHLVAANLHPVLRLRDAGRVHGVDAQAERRAPEEVGDKAHGRAVPGEYPRTRSLKPLLGRHLLVGLRIEVGLHDAVRPEDPRDVDGPPRAQPEMHRLAADDLSLREEPAADFDLPADAERVDALIAGRRLRPRTDDLPVIALAALADERGVLRDQVEHPVVVHIDNGDCFRVDGLPSLKGSAHIRDILWGDPFRVSEPEPRPAAAGDDDVEGAVVVEILQEDAIAPGGAGGNGVRPARDFVAAPLAVAHPRRPDRATRIERHDVEDTVPLTSPTVAATTVPRSAGPRISRNSPACRLSKTRRSPFSPTSTTSPSPSPSTSPHANARAPITPANGCSVFVLPSPLFRSTSGSTPRLPMTRSRSPSISTSAAHTANASASLTVMLFLNDPSGCCVKRRTAFPGTT